MFGRALREDRLPRQRAEGAAASDRGRSPQRRPRERVAADARGGGQGASENRPVDERAKLAKAISCRNDKFLFAAQSSVRPAAFFTSLLMGLRLLRCVVAASAWWSIFWMSSRS